MKSQGLKFIIPSLLISVLLNIKKSYILFIIPFLITYSFIIPYDSYSSENTALEGLKKGKEFYENGDFDKSIDELKKAISEFKELKLPSEKIKDNLYEANLYTGLNYLGMY